MPPKTSSRRWQRATSRFKSARSRRSSSRLAWLSRVRSPARFRMSRGWPLESWRPAKRLMRPAPSSASFPHPPLPPYGRPVAFSSAIKTESRSPHEAGHRSLAAHLRLLELGGGNRPVERGAQLLGGLERDLDPRARAGIEGSVDEVERDDIAQRRMARVVIGHHRLREREPFVPTLGHALGAGDLDDGGAHVWPSYFLARCLPKKANTLLQPSIACSGR